MRFEEFLLESDASEEAKRQGLVSAGWGLWKDKQGKVVARTVDGKLEPVKGSRADITNYHTNVPQNRQVNHDAIDEVNDTMDKHMTPGTKVETEVTKYAANKISAVHPDKAKFMHDDLIKSGFKYEKDEDFGSHVYRKGRVSISISGKPEVSHKPGTKRDHLSVVATFDHVGIPRKKKS